MRLVAAISLTLLLSITATAQVESLKHAVVKVLIDDMPQGTGFFIDQNLILTCLHVIKPAIVPDSRNNPAIGKKISIQFFNGETVPVTGMHKKIFMNMADAVKYDYCIIGIGQQPKITIKPLKLGNFNDVKEADEIYSMGYPEAINEYFISKGIIAAKYTEKGVDKAWMDIEVSNGCSGAPVLKDGLVIGIVNKTAAAGINGLISIEYSKDLLK